MPIAILSRMDLPAKLLIYFQRSKEQYHRRVRVTKSTMKENTIIVRQGCDDLADNQISLLRGEPHNIFVLLPRIHARS